MTPVINMQNYMSIRFRIKLRVQPYIVLVISKLLMSGAAPPVFRMPS